MRFVLRSIATQWHPVLRLIGLFVLHYLTLSPILGGLDSRQRDQYAQHALLADVLSAIGQISKQQQRVTELEL